MPVIGDKSIFAIEFKQVDGILGTFCFWINNTRLGDYTDQINLWTPKNYLREFLQYENTRFFPKSHLMSKELLKYVLQDWIYEGDLNPVSEYLVSFFREKWRPAHVNEMKKKEQEYYETTYYWIHGRLTDVFALDYVGAGAFLDNVQILLLNEYELSTPRQRIIWYDIKAKETYEHFLPKHYFDTCAKEFEDTMAVSLEYLSPE